MSKNTKFEAEMNKEMLPVIVVLTKEIDFKYIPSVVWNRIKENV